MGDSYAVVVVKSLPEAVSNAPIALLWPTDLFGLIDLNVELYELIVLVALLVGDFGGDGADTDIAVAAPNYYCGVHVQVHHCRD